MKQWNDENRKQVIESNQKILKQTNIYSGNAREETRCYGNWAVGMLVITAVAQGSQWKYGLIKMNFTKGYFINFTKDQDVSRISDCPIYQGKYDSDWYEWFLEADNTIHLQHTRNAWKTMRKEFSNIMSCETRIY